MSDLINGSIRGGMIRFAVPMIFGNILQQIYTASAAIIVGQYLGEKSFAALGVGGAVTNFIAFIIIGMCMGATVVFSELYGSGRLDRFKLALSTSIIAGIAFSALLGFAALGLNTFVFGLIRTPPEIIGEASRYLSIMSSALVLTFLNMLFTSAFYAMGNSRIPLVFLAASSGANIALTLLFVASLGWGVAGAAWAIVASQGISVLLYAAYIYFRVPELRLLHGEWGFDTALLRRIAEYGGFTAMQQACVNLGRVLVQGAVNPLGVGAIAAFNAAAQIDAFLLTPCDSFSSATTAFVAQNRGAGRFRRVREAFSVSIKIGLSYSLLGGFVVFLMPTTLIRLCIDTPDPKILADGGAYLRFMAFFYSLATADACIQGFFRGFGMIKTTFLASFTQILVRVVTAWLVTPYLGVSGVAVGSGLGWGVMLALLLGIYFRHVRPNVMALCGNEAKAGDDSPAPRASS